MKDVKRFPAFLRNLSVSWKFILAYYLVLIIPMAFFGVYFYMKSSDDSISQAKMIMERNLLQTRASIMQKVNLIENITQIITTNDSVQSVFYYEYEKENDRLKDFQFNVSPMLENVYSQNNLIYSIRIYTPKTIFTEMSGSYYSIRKEDSPEKFGEVESSMHSEGGWVTAHGSIGNMLRTDAGDQEQVFSYSGSILSPVSASGASIGTVEIEVREDLLFDMLRDPVMRKWGQIFAANQDGTIVSNNIPDLYLKNVSSMGFTDFDNKNAVNKLEKINGTESIVITTPVDDIDCSIIGIFPVENFNSDARASIANLLIVLTVLSVLIGFIIYFLTNVLLRRVKILVRAMKQVKENNLDVSVPVNSTDEFGELALNFNHMTGRIHELVETVYKIQLLERDAELKALEAQINPHFLYNTLATISWVGRRGNQEEVVRISNSLAKYYRLVLSKGGTTIAVKDEIDMVRAYLQIQKIRFGEMFDVEYRLDDEAMGCMIMKNLLQPLVENALNHGIEPKRGHGTLIVRVELVNKDLVLQVIDDGVGMDSRTLADVSSGRVERTSGGYAVKNVIERLKAYYDRGHSFEVFSRPGIGAQFTITIRAGGF